MMAGAVRACLERAPGARRWHFQHGPIDLIIGAEGEDEALDASCKAAWRRFDGVLAELVAELPALRTPVPLNDALRAGEDDAGLSLRGPVARRMLRACLPFARLDQLFVTPMAAVAGSVAQEIIAAFQRPGIARAWVNNGGDIAWFGSLSGGCAAGEAVLKVALHELGPGAHLQIAASEGCWGIATSGWRGRSQSLGIADSVTVLAPDAATADVAATLVANAVSLHPHCPEHPAIRRLPASQVKDDSDLGELLVTVDVGVLSTAEVALALASGESYARRLLDRGAINGAVLCLAGQWRFVGPQSPALQGPVPGGPDTAPASCGIHGVVESTRQNRV